MKYYESTFDDYLKSNKLFNVPPELNHITNNLPRCIAQLENLIIYGPAGVGKYTQTLKILSNYSESELKYDKRLEVITDKQNYMMRFSDIHYEIDMSLLGCNAKTLWYEIFFQIVDIVSIKKEKFGVIVCKNFHHINSELLEVFYSYMHHYDKADNIQIKFIVLTEQISFIPNKIVNICDTISIPRLTDSAYTELNNINNMLAKNTYHSDFPTKVSKYLPEVRIQDTDSPYQPNCLIEEIEKENIGNIKDMKSFTSLKTTDEIPEDIFDIISNKIISEMTNINQFQFTQFRDTLYDILIYNIDIFECIWTVITHFVNIGRINQEDCSDIIAKTYTFFKQYNNNYRPIYHLESIMFYIINKLHQYELRKGV